MLGHVLLGAQIALAWFCLGTLAGGAALFASSPAVRRSRAASLRPATFLTWRLLPSAVPLLATAALVIPAYVWLEPRGGEETAGGIVRSLAVGGGLLLAAGLARGWLSVRRTARAFRSRVAGSRPIGRLHPDVPTFATPGAGALMLLAGVFRPRLYISECVLVALEPDELEAAIAHEVAHHRSWDNLKRHVLAFAPDLVSWTAHGRELERRWQASAELAADAAATAGLQKKAASLASALVKVARLSGGRPLPDYGCAPFHDGHPIASRVRRLIEGDYASTAPRRAGIARLAFSVAATGLVLGAFQWQTALAFVQELTELLVRLP